MEPREHRANKPLSFLSIGRLGMPLVAAVLVAAFWLVGDGWLWAQADGEVPSVPPRPHPLQLQSQDEAAAKDLGCLSCHEGIEKMHANPGVHLACVDCHGGDETAILAFGTAPESAEYDATKQRAHVLPEDPDFWWGDGDRSPSANPERTYTRSLRVAAEFIRFVNPGDLRVAEEACGSCHQTQVNNTRKSTMTTASIFWAAAAYANGILPLKSAILGESYGRDGEAQAIQPKKPLTEEEIARGARPFTVPMPRWEVIQPGEYFRAFERGGIFQPSVFPEIGLPNILDESGRPDIRVSNRGRGTGLRISPALINIHKTRLNDPHLSFFGTNDHPGDYRSSGCSGCHVVYANDREPLHSGPWAQYGHMGETATGDSTIPKNESGHPALHRFTRSIPTSQCMVCHMHQPNSFVNPYLGYLMWDYVTDAEHMWPEEQKYPTEAEKRKSLDHNPEGAAVRGLWTDLDFLSKVSELNPKLEHTQFADYHGHGWVFRGVYKRDRKGNLLDADGEIVPFDDPEKFAKAVHLKDIHLERGMHCADCHFSRDAHGDGLLHGEYGDAIEIECQDCHGDRTGSTDLKTSGPAAPVGGTDLSLGTTPFGRRRFAWKQTPNGRRLFQRSMMRADVEWEVVQVSDTLDPEHPRYNETAARAKTVQKDGCSWGGDPEAGAEMLAHNDDEMTCYSCHSSWMTGCFGCHLPQEANVKAPSQHYEGGESRNFASYNPQALRTNTYILGVNGTTKGNKIAPVRSSSALILSSTNANRQRFYLQQAPISAPGFSSQAFNPHVPHTVRTTETKMCEDCHISEKNDNNAWMAQLLGQGTNFVNFIGRFAWVGLGDHKGLEAVAVTEFEEPQAVIGSYLHSKAYPDFFREHEEEHLELQVKHHHHAHDDIHSLQLRGEYLHMAMGHGGYWAMDVANIDNKDFSERIVSAPTSKFGQQPNVKTEHATAVALPTNMPIAPARRTSLDYPDNQEQPFHPLYRYAYISDSHEGLVLVNVDTLTDGDPANNFLKRELIYGKESYNPDHILEGATNLTVAGNYVYVVADAGLVVIDFGDFLEPEGEMPVPQPKVVAVLDGITEPTAVAVQFRYAFVTDGEGLAVIDITDPTQPSHAARVPIADARNVYVARTYAYVAAGSEGIVIVDVESPDKPWIDQVYDADGELHDTWDVKVGTTYSTLFAYVADGEHGFKVVQLTSPKTTPGYLGFSPRPAPHLISTVHTHGPALAVSKGLDRDRAADESGNQVSIFNRIGARPLNLTETQRHYLQDGALYTVSNTATQPPMKPMLAVERKAVEPPPVVEEPGPTTATVHTRSDQLRVRSVPGLDGRIITHVRNGESFAVVETSEDSAWICIEVSVRPKCGWVAADFVSLSPAQMKPDSPSEEVPSAPDTPPAPEAPARAEWTESGSQTATIRTSTDELRVRSVPGLDGRIITHVRNGESFAVLETSEDGAWVCIEVSVRPECGWVAADFVSLSPAQTAPEAMPGLDARIITHVRNGGSFEVVEASEDGARICIEVSAQRECGWVADFFSLSAAQTTSEVLPEDPPAPELMPKKAPASPDTPAAAEAPEAEAAPSLPEAQEARTATIRTSTDELRVRSVPGLDGRIITHVRNGESFAVLETSEDGAWVCIEVSVRPECGWVSTDFVELTTDPDRPES